MNLIITGTPFIVLLANSDDEGPGAMFYTYFTMQSDGSIVPLSEGDSWRKFNFLPIYETLTLAQARPPSENGAFCDEISLEEALGRVVTGKVRAIKIIHAGGETLIDDIRSARLYDQIQRQKFQ